MNQIKNRQTFSCVLALGLALLTSNANAVTINLEFDDQYYLGSVSNPTPANPAADLQRIQNLISVALGNTMTILSTGGGGANTAVYTRSNNFPVLPGVGAGCSQGGNGNEHFAIGCDYFIQKYAGTGQNGNAYVWYIADLVVTVDDLETPIRDSENFQANQWQAFDASPLSVPEPATLSLLGLGLLGMVGARRRRKT